MGPRISASMSLRTRLSRTSGYHSTSLRSLFENIPRHMSSVGQTRRQERRAHSSVRRIDEAALRSSYGTSHVLSTTQVSEPTSSSSQTYRIILDNGKEVVAKTFSSHPDAGPSSLIAASEVATMDFARRKLNIPVPRVLDYHVSSMNDVGSEYIIMDAPRGVPLRSVWDSMSLASKMSLMKKLGRLENKFMKETFDMGGSLYYERDWEPELCPAGSCTPEALIVGPSTQIEFWRGDRGAIEMNRGPWESPADYISAVALREISYITSYAQALPQNHTLQTQGEIGDPVAHLQSLNDYLSLAPSLVPSKDPSLSIFCLWHPDLSGNNIYVSQCMDEDGASSYDITDVTGWQHALIAPIYLQARIPSVIRQVGPKNGASKSPSASLRRRLDTLSQKDLDTLTRQVLLHTYEANSPSTLFASSPHLTTVSNPTHLANSTLGTLWSESLPPFHAALAAVANNWSGIWTELHGGAEIPPCPVQFDSALLTVLEDWVISQPYLNNMVGRVGSISPKGFAEARGNNNIFS